MRQKKGNTNNITKGGFTLLETIVAVGVLAVVIIGPLTLASASIRAAMSSQNQITAFYLAQEGIEYVRNIRDSNSTGGGWLNGLDNCKGVDGCYADVFDDTVLSDPVNENLPACPAEGCSRLWYNAANGHYDYDPVSDPDSYETIFRRTVKLIQADFSTTNEYTIKVVVEWSGRYGDKQLSVQENILNW